MVNVDYIMDLLDWNNSIEMQEQGVPTYVATPLGTLRKYDPSNGTVIVLFIDIPFDPNHTLRK